MTVSYNHRNPQKGDVTNSCYYNHEYHYEVAATLSGHRNVLVSNRPTKRGLYSISNDIRSCNGEI
jgi:hypothetical protein